MTRERKRIVPTKKTETVSELVGKLKNATMLLLANYQGVPGTDGLPVKKIRELRQKLRENKAELKIAKNTLAKKAMIEIGGFDLLFPYMEGATSLTIGYDDPVLVAKTLLDFAKAHKTPKNENGLPEVKAGLLEGKFLNPESVKALAFLPSKQVLLATLLGAIQAPASNFMRTANAPLQNFLTILEQLRKQKEN